MYKYINTPTTTTRPLFSISNMETNSSSTFHCIVVDITQIMHTNGLAIVVILDILYSDVVKNRGGMDNRGGES
jgi:hypothetical protein